MADESINQGNDLGTESQGQSTDDFKTVEEAQAWKDSVYADSKHPYFNTGLFGDAHSKAVTKMFRANEKIKPEGDRQSILEPDRGLHDIVSKEFINPEHIESQAASFREDIENRKFERAKADALNRIRLEFGQETEQVINYAHYGVDRFLKNSLSEADWKELDGAMGNDPVFIKKLSDVISYLDEKYWNGKNRSYKREETKK
jgi:hypothetical protein